MTVRIAPLKQRDARKYAALFRHVINACPYYSLEAKRDQIREHVGREFDARRAQKKNIYLAAYIAEELCGFCFGKEDAGTFWIEWYGVAPAFRKQGIARALVTEMGRLVRKRKIQKLWCDSRTSNRESNALLTSQRFKKVAHLRKHWYGHDFYLWVKTL